MRLWRAVAYCTMVWDGTVSSILPEHTGYSKNSRKDTYLVMDSQGKEGLLCYWSLTSSLRHHMVLSLSIFFTARKKYEIIEKMCSPLLVIQCR